MLSTERTEAGFADFRPFSSYIVDDFRRVAGAPGHLRHWEPCTKPVGDARGPEVVRLPGQGEGAELLQVCGEHRDRRFALRSHSVTPRHGTFWQ